MEIINIDHFREERLRIKKHTLNDVILQLRFDSLEEVLKGVPFEFQKSIKEEFPNISVQKRNSFLINLNPSDGSSTGATRSESHSVYNYISKEGNLKVSLCHDSLTLTSNSAYEGWDHFSKKFDYVLKAFLGHYDVKNLKRIGLRYRNMISKKKLEIEGMEWGELIKPAVLGYFSLKHLGNFSTEKLEVVSDIKQLDLGECKLIFRTGITDTKEKEKEKVFYIDTDLYKLDSKAQLSVDTIIPTLRDMHELSFPIFRDSITDKLFNELCR